MSLSGRLWSRQKVGRPSSGVSLHDFDDADEWSHEFGIGDADVGEAPGAENARKDQLLDAFREKHDKALKNERFRNDPCSSRMRGACFARGVSNRCCSSMGRKQVSSMFGVESRVLNKRRPSRSINDWPSAEVKPRPLDGRSILTAARRRPARPSARARPHNVRRIGSPRPRPPAIRCARVGATRGNAVVPPPRCC